jgi:translocation and assembly module TamA
MKLPRIYYFSFAYLLLLLTLPLKSFSASNLIVNIEGLQNPLLENVSLTLSIFQRNKETTKDTLDENTIRRLHRSAEKEILQALQPFGFYSPDIKTTLINTEGQWQANYIIDPGLPTRVNTIDIRISGEGKNEAEIKKLIRDIPVVVGSAINHQDYENLKQQLFDTLFNLGYLDVTYNKKELQIDTENRKANILLFIDSGKKYYFGDITIEQDIIEPEKIQQLITINSDTPFNTDQLIDLQLRLSDTGYFDQIQINVERDRVVDQRIPVTIATTPSKRMKYSTSIGYGTDTGARVGLSVLNRRVNRRGHRFQYNIRLSEIESNINANYAIPIGDIYTEYWDFSINGKTETVNDIESVQYSIGSSLNQNRWGGRRRLSLTLLQEDFSFDDGPDETTVLLIPGVNYTRTVSDNALFTRNGYRITADLQGGIKSALSDTTFLRGYLNASHVLSLTERSRLINRFELGALSTDDFNLMPPSLRFFTGGSQSVRGYGYKDISPTNSSGNNIGGEYLVSASIEMDYLISGNYGMALFYDIGDANDSTDFSFKDSVGIGFRYKSPIGMIRVDLAHPFADAEDDVRLHIRIGPDL